MKDKEYNNITNEEIDSYKREVTVDFNRWSPLKRSHTDEELKKLVRDVDMSLVYTDKHAIQSNVEITNVFMILVFLFGDTGKRINGSTKEEIRKNKIYNLLLQSEKEAYFKTIGKTEEEARKEYIESIGMVYEYMSEASPMGINGQPCFMSCKFLSTEDTVRFWELYGAYIKMKDALDMEFGMY